MHSNNFSCVGGSVSGEHSAVSNEEEMEPKQINTIVPAPLGIIKVVILVCTRKLLLDHKSLIIIIGS